MLKNLLLKSIKVLNVKSTTFCFAKLEIQDSILASKTLFIRSASVFSEFVTASSSDIL